MNYIKNKIKIPRSLFIEMIMNENYIVYDWLNFELKNKEIYNLISGKLNEKKLQFIRKNKKHYINLLINSVAFYGLEIENHVELFDDCELIKILDVLFKFSKNHGDINTIDSIVEILKKKNHLIDKVDINLLYFLKEHIQEDFFMFLKNDIDKILLLKKLSKLSKKEKTNVTKI